MITPAGIQPLSVLLLALSPLLRAEIVGLLGRVPDGGATLQLHMAEARERELAATMATTAPQVVLVPLDPGSGRALDGSREMSLIAQLVARWRVPTLVLGLREGQDTATVAAVERICRAAGAVGYLPRERWVADGSGLRTRIGAAARVKVLRPLADVEAPPSTLPETDPPPLVAPMPPRGATGPIVVVGASAGGPTALREFLRAIRPDIPAPIVIAQHLPPAFSAPLATDLSRFTSFGVRVAAIGDLLMPGRALLVPGRRSLLLDNEQIVGMIAAEHGEAHGRVIDRTMETVAAVYGGGTVGVILSGMGDDGVRGLAAIKARGGLALGQDEATCQVYGMPRRAAELGVLDRVGPPAALGAALNDLFAQRIPARAAQT